MGLLSIFKRKSDQSPGAAEATGRGAGKSAPRSRQARSAAAAATTYAEPPDAAEAVREARARARRRLMGATVLLLAGVIGFPLLFETQPRPIPVDLPIDIPARTAPAGNDAAVPGSGHRTGAGGTTTGAQTLAGRASVAQESVSYDARPSTAAPASASVAATSHATGDATRLAANETNRTATGESNRASASDTSRAGPSAAPHADAHPSSAAEAANSASRAYALLNATAPAPADTSTTAPAGGDAASDASRFVVQIGAFADDAKMRDARAKVEKLGLKTYTQSVDTPAGKRVRVRVGPYATHADADKAAARIKADGLPAAVLVL
jgi:DedD protein